MDFTQTYDRYAALAEEAFEPAVAALTKREPEWFDPVGEDGDVLDATPEELAEEIHQAIRTALEELTTWASLAQLEAEGRARDVLVADLAQDASRLFPHYWRESEAHEPPTNLLRTAVAETLTDELAELGPAGLVAVVRVTRDIQNAVFSDRTWSWGYATPEQRAQILADLARTADGQLPQVLEQLDWQWGSAAKHASDEEGYFVFPDAEPRGGLRPPPAHPGARAANKAKPKRIRRPKSHGKHKR